MSVLLVLNLHAEVVESKGGRQEVFLEVAARGTYL